MVMPVLIMWDMFGQWKCNEASDEENWGEEGREAMGEGGEHVHRREYVNAIDKALGNR